MRAWLRIALTLAALTSVPATSIAQQHVVASGQTLGRIAKRYNISIEALCKANGISRRDPIRPGQKLIIPDDDETIRPPEVNEDAARAAPEDEKDSKNDRALGGGLRELMLPTGPAYYYPPLGAGRLGLKPVIVYLHGRGGNPQSDCRRWAGVTRRFGWLICPSGPVPYGEGRAWNNNWPSAHTATMGAIQALRDKYGRRVQLWGNTLIGFSEGAYAAMNVGVREPRTFNRWLILAANSKYWGGPGLEALGSARDRVRRVFLITGQNDGVIDGTHQVEEWLKKAGVPTRVLTPDDMGHEVWLEKRSEMYRSALGWLDKG